MDTNLQEQTKTLRQCVDETHSRLSLLGLAMRITRVCYRDAKEKGEMEVAIHLAHIRMRMKMEFMRRGKAAPRLYKEFEQAKLRLKESLAT